MCLHIWEFCLFAIICLISLMWKLGWDFPSMHFWFGCTTWQCISMFSFVFCLIVHVRTFWVFCFQMLASASGPHGLSVSQICIWDLEQMVLKRTLTHHQFDVVCLTYARDDRFLISVGMFNMRGLKPKFEAASGSRYILIFWCTKNILF